MTEFDYVELIVGPLKWKHTYKGTLFFIKHSIQGKLFHSYTDIAWLLKTKKTFVNDQHVELDHVDGSIIPIFEITPESIVTIVL